jgi:hypothetical protein
MMMMMMMLMILSLSGVWNSWNAWQGKPKYPEETCPSTTLSTSNPKYLTWIKTRAASMGSPQLNA